MGLLNKELAWYYLVSPEEWSIPEDKRIRYLWECKDENDKLVHGLLGKSDKKTICHTMEFEWNVSFNNGMTAKITMYNLSDSNALIVNKGEYYNIMSMGAATEKKMLVNLQITAYNKTLNNYMLVTNCYTTGYPTRKTTFTGTMLNTNTLAKGNRGQQISYTPKPNATRGEAIKELASKYNLQYPYSGDMCLCNDELLPQGFSIEGNTDLMCAFQQINPNLYFYEEQTKTSNNYLRCVANLDNIGSFAQKHETIKQKVKQQITQFDTQLKNTANNKKYHTINAFYGEVYNTPYYLEGTLLIQIETLLRVDIKLGDYVNLILEKDELVKPFAGQNGVNLYQVKEIRHKARFSMTTETMGRTTLVLINCNEQLKLLNEKF